ncbi:MAG: hypothetical protein ACE37F_14480 [Nannocystaceae bacterium]|nr:hypothetical protein [bacterium]
MTSRTLLFAILSTSLLVPGCNDTSPRDDGAAHRPLDKPTVEHVNEHIGSFVGKTVTLYGEVDEVHSNQAFVLEGNDWLFDHELLVVTPTPINMRAHGVDEDDRIAVRGTVRNLVTVEFERDFDLDLKPELEAEFETHPVLVAEEIDAVRGIAQWRAEDEKPDPAIVSVWSLHSTPDIRLMAGRAVELPNARVMSKTGDALWLGRSHFGQLLVEPPKGTDVGAFEIGDTVKLAGTIGLMPSAAEAVSRWNIPVAFTDELRDEPIYVDAESLERIELDEEPVVSVAYTEFVVQPASFADRVVEGRAQVTRVISDRAFFMKGKDGEILGIVKEGEDDHELDIDPGDEVEFTALVTPGHHAEHLAGESLEKDAKEAVEGRNFLAMLQRDTKVVSEN